MLNCYFCLGLKETRRSYLLETFGVETDPVLHYMNTCIGLKDTQEFGWIKADPVNYVD